MHGKTRRPNLVPAPARPRAVLRAVMGTQWVGNGSVRRWVKLIAPRPSLSGRSLAGPGRKGSATALQNGNKHSIEQNPLISVPTAYRDGKLEGRVVAVWPEMALGSEMGGRGPKPRFYRTVRPLPKANSTGGGHGAAFPSPNPNPSSTRPHTRDQSRQARTPMAM